MTLALELEPAVPWATPWLHFADWWKDYHFTVDAAASRENAKVRPHNPVCSWRDEISPGNFCRGCKRFIGRYYTMATNGLDWRHYKRGDVVFCNPPYTSHGPSRLANWIRLAALTARRLGVRWFMVLPPSIDAAWFHDYIWDRRTKRPREGVILDFWRGRIHFDDPTPKKRKGGRQGTMLVEFLPCG